MNHIEIIKRLCDNNCDTYMVGGGIRDMLLGLVPDDFDVVTKATPEQVVQLFPDCDVKTVGKSFGVVLVDGFEVATFRQDIHDEEMFRVKYADTIHEDLSRRDLTINAIAYCELTGALIDNHGGREDLKSRTIKFVGNPDHRILEDPDRMIRACRFVAKIGGTFDPDTLIALQRHAAHFGNYKVAPERVRVEILKAMKIPRASLFFEALHLTGLLQYIFPKLDYCYGHPHGVHHTEDVFEHCMICGDSISTKDPILKLAGYLHDAGKPQAYDSIQKTFIQHEKYAARFLRDNLKFLTFSRDETNKVCGLVRHHMNSIHEISPKATRKLLKRLDDASVQVSDFMRLRMADRKANLNRVNYTVSEYKAMYQNLVTEGHKEVPMAVGDLAVKGGDLIQEFCLVPGPIVSDLQKCLLCVVIEYGVEANSPPYLLYQAGKILGE